MGIAPGEPQRAAPALYPLTPAGSLPGAEYLVALVLRRGWRRTWSWQKTPQCPHLEVPAAPADRVPRQHCASFLLLFPRHTLGQRTERCTSQWHPSVLGSARPHPACPSCPSLGPPPCAPCAGTPGAPCLLLCPSPGRGAAGSQRRPVGSVGNSIWATPAGARQGVSACPPRPPCSPPSEVVPPGELLACRSPRAVSPRWGLAWRSVATGVWKKTASVPMPVAARLRFLVGVAPPKDSPAESRS